MTKIIKNIQTIYIIPPLLTFLVAVTLSILSILKKKVQTENILFAVVCIWWSLLSPVFLLHFILINDIATIIKIERVVHFFYVFIPPINLLFFQNVLKKNINKLIITCTIISLGLAVITQSPYYIESLNIFEWGYIAKAGIAMQFFGVYSIIILLYMIYLCVIKIKSESNIIIKRKIKFILLSINLCGLLTVTNMPAMMGYNFYPLGNFIFIPLTFMAYGVLKYKLMDIRSILHVSMIWIITSSLFLVPNIIIFNYMRKYIHLIQPLVLFILLVIWFLINYYYLNFVQPLINRVFNTFNYNLAKEEKSFVNSIFNLRDLDGMILQFTQVIKQQLHFSDAHFLLGTGDSLSFQKDNNTTIKITPEVMIFLLNTKTHLNKHVIETNPKYKKIKHDLLEILNRFSATYLVSLVHNCELPGILLLPEKNNHKALRTFEINFLHTIKSSAAIALSNSLMYQNLANLKNNLQNLVLERTATIERQKRTLEIEIELAKKIQLSLLPRQLPEIDQIDIAYKYIPTSGIGGDFIDIHYRTGMDELGLFVCDVSGHGVPAALTASMVKMSLNVWGKYIDSPKDIMNEISTSMKEKLADNFFTACICTLNLQTGILKFANAGHPPVLIIHNDKSITSYNAKGSMISELIGHRCEQGQVSLQKGDKIVLYTDGITEARNTLDELMTEQKFIKTLSEYSSLSPENLCGEIYNDLLEFSNNKITLDDDFTILIAEYK